MLHQTKDQTMCGKQLGLVILLLLTLATSRGLNAWFDAGVEGSPITGRLGLRHVVWVSLLLPWAAPSRAKLEMEHQVISF